MCDFKDPQWLPMGDGCRTQPEWVITYHYLGYPSGKVASGESTRLCSRHILSPIAGVLADEGKKHFGMTVMRLGETDKIAGVREIGR